MNQNTKAIQASIEAKNTLKQYRLVWSPTGKTIATVKACTSKRAVKRTPKPYHRYRGEVYAVEV